MTGAGHSAVRHWRAHWPDADRERPQRVGKARGDDPPSDPSERLCLAGTDFYGTSAADASVAGVAALMLLQANPNLTPAQTDQILEESAAPMADSAVSGVGLVQADVALAACFCRGTMIRT